MGTIKESQGSGKSRKILSSVLVVVLATTLLLPFNLQTAFAAPTSAEKQAEADEASAALAASEEQMLELRDDYRAAVIAHDEAVEKMEEAQVRIDSAEAVISDTQESLGTRANQMYRDGQLSYLEVLFGATSFEAFTTIWELINTINEENAVLIQTNKDARAEAQAARDEYAEQERAAADRLAEAERVKIRAEELVAEQQALLAGLEAEVAALVEAEQAARLAAAATNASQEAYNSGGTNYADNTNNPEPVPVPDGGYSDVVSAAAGRIGCPYVYGATGPNTFDCSGLTSWCYQQSGRGWIGRTDSAQYSNAAARWSYASGGAQPGDVLWWPGHVAIYEGGGSYIHAPYPGTSVSRSSWNINSATVLRF